MGYLLDTNICIYIIKKKPESVLKRLREISLGEIGLSAITVAELQYGARKSSNPEKNLTAFQQFLLAFDIFPFDNNASAEYGKVRGMLEANGTPIGPLDTLIAAHAKRLNYTLVTNNEREFRRVVGLEVENWVEL
jgi:tRNA(fMet)-specific endonuclease VapC